MDIEKRTQPNKAYLIEMKRKNKINFTIRLTPFFSETGPDWYPVPSVFSIPIVYVPVFCGCTSIHYLKLDLIMGTEPTTAKKQTGGLNRTFIVGNIFRSSASFHLNIFVFGIFFSIFKQNFSFHG